jgi:superfamily II DNA or RNA helicase
MDLRPYQQQSVDAVLNGFDEYDRLLGVCPTGGGKTIIFAKLVQAFAPRRSLIFAHREELISQAVDKIQQATGLFAEVEKAERSASRDATVVVASIQTMMRRFQEWDPDHFDLIVCDEAHHSVSKSWQTALSHFTRAKVLGVTATPDRGDKKNLGSYYESIAFEITLFDLIRQGFLSPIKVKALPLQIDLTNVRTIAGDFNEADLGDALAPYLKEIAHQLCAQAAERKTLVFVPLIATSKNFVDICRGLGIRAAHVDGMSADRRQILSDYRAGKYALLSNAMLLTEGYDEPSINCVTILRPTQSRPLYSQMVGRGTRIAPGKTDLLLLDFLWLHEKHNLIRPAHLIAKDADMAQAMTEMVERGAAWDADQSEFDLGELENSAREAREEKLRKELEAKAKRSARSVDALEYCLSIGNLDAADYEPTMAWHSQPITAGQKTTLENFGIDVETIKNKGHASALLSALMARRKMNMASPKQVHWLREKGHPNPETATADEASSYLDFVFGASKSKRKQRQTMAGAMTATV